MSGPGRQRAALVRLSVPRSGGGNRSDMLLPLINVACLLLTFFLIVCALAVGDAPPTARAGAVTLQVDAKGALHFQSRTMPAGEAVIAIRNALAAMPHGSLYVRADRKLPASIILPLLRKLRESGIASIRVVPVGPA